MPSGGINPTPADKFKSEYIKGVAPTEVKSGGKSDADINQEIPKSDNPSGIGKDRAGKSVDVDPSTDADVIANEDASEGSK
jgi:hypothetical protein